MQPTFEQIVDILKQNYYISQLYDYFFEDISYDYISEESGYINIDINIQSNDFETKLPLTIDVDFYDEKFSDVDKYEVDDMGIKIAIWTGSEPDELNTENIWRHLFFEKEPITSKK